MATIFVVYNFEETIVKVPECTGYRATMMPIGVICAELEDLSASGFEVSNELRQVRELAERDEFEVMIDNHLMSRCRDLTLRINAIKEIDNAL